VECLELFSKYLVVKNNLGLRTPVIEDLDKCLESYGNMYKRLNIEIVLVDITSLPPANKTGKRPPVLPASDETDEQRPLLPADDDYGRARIQSSMNMYMREIGRDEPGTAYEANQRIQKLNMYSLLLYDNFREYYNDFYMRKKLFTAPVEISGGKRRRKLTRKMRKKSRTR
jgi:hypothetical protein